MSWNKVGLQRVDSPNWMRIETFNLLTIHEQASPVLSLVVCASKYGINNMNISGNLLKGS